MGVDHYTARFLLQARAAGHGFGRTLTIGRQNFFVTRPQLDRLAGEFGFDSLEFLKSHRSEDLVYLEPFLAKVVGAGGVESIDASGYEAATHIHDMNRPLPEGLRGQFETVIEAGSLEHIFNFPTAIGNLMGALKPGGKLFIQTPANNYFGHGFYQFSPELFYRVLSEENGFRVERMELLEHFYPCHFFQTPLYQVADPAKVGKRVQLVNKTPSLLMIEATRIEVVEPFRTTPQQSDYVPLWDSSTPAAPTPTCLTASWKDWVYRLPLGLFRSLWLQYRGGGGSPPSVKNREFFKRV